MVTGSSSTRTFQALGFPFRFASDDAVLVEVIGRLYADMAEATGDAGTIRASWNAAGTAYEVTYESPSGEVDICEEYVLPVGVLEVITWEVNDRATTSRAGWPTLHAAVVAGPGGAVALCGSSHSGKSTLAAAAARRGWVHFSDDLGPVDVARMEVHPYARPIMVREGGRELLGELPPPPEAHRAFAADSWFYPSTELGAQQADGPRPLVAVVLLAWGDEPGLEPVSRAQTLFGLVQSSTTIGRRGAEEFAELEQIAMAVPGYRLTLDGPQASLDLLAPLVGTV